MLSPVDSIFNLLLDHSPQRVSFAGRELTEALGHWAAHPSNVLVRVASAPQAGGGGWILVEAGQPTSAHAGPRPAGEALAALQAQAPSGSCQAALLAGAEWLLACAVSRGKALAFRQPVTGEDRRLLPALQGRQFPGVLLLEQGSDLRIWSDRGAGWTADPVWPDAPDGYRKSLFRWSTGGEEPHPGAHLLHERQTAASLWQALERELVAELDERAPRMLARLRREHGRDDVSTLLQNLMPHLERVSGADAAHRFRQRFLNDWLGEA